ncbi:phosphatase PAP2 family protein [Rothia sp. P4278]|uniref:phosphatase PAP2 family protein n=1 Tax=Rothia sp. P4278 TaxID=3402658 RepID=UPI003AEF0C63
MSFKERDTRAISGVPDDATEVLATPTVTTRVVPQPEGQDPTMLLSAPTPHKGPTAVEDADATVVLPVSAQQTAPQSSQDSAPTAPLGTFDPDPDATLVLPSSRPAAPTMADPTVPLKRDELKTKLQESGLQGINAAKTGLATAKAKAMQTAERVRQERAARAASNAQERPVAQQTPTAQQAPLTAQRQPRPLYAPAHTAPARSYQQAQPLPPHMLGVPGQPVEAHAGENSPSGRLQMLTPSHIRQTRPSLWTLIQHFFAAGTLFFLMVAAFFFFVGTSIGQELDEVSFQEFSYQFMTYTDQTSSLLDSIPAAAGIIAAVGILFVLVWKHRFLPALVGLGMALGANLSSQVLKNYIIVKPDLGIQEALINSAPSGHTTFAAASGLALFLASPKRFRPTVALLSMCFTVAAGYSTVINGWHRPGDVITAITLTGLWGVLGLVILRFMRSEELDMSNTQRSGLILVPLLSISGFFVGFCAAALYWVTYTNPIPGSAFMAALCLIASVAAFTTCIQVALLRPQNKQRSAYKRVWAY